MPRIAVVVGGAESTMTEVDQARALCVECGCEPQFFVINDMISLFPGEVIAVSLHPDKLPGWLNQRSNNGLPAPLEVWSHRPNKIGVTHHTRDWGGSSGMLAAKIAMEKGLRSILCGVPMTVQDKHFMRHQPWNACSAFWRAWITHKADLAPHVRSMSGNTRDLLGAPDAEWLTETSKEDVLT